MTIESCRGRMGVSGSVAEWTKAVVLKTTVFNRTVGSNPTTSAPIMCKRLPLEFILEVYEGECQICFKRCKIEDASRHHVHPASLGGHSNLENLVLAHKWCNNRMANDDGVGWVKKSKFRRELLYKFGSAQAVIAYLAPFPK